MDTEKADQSIAETRANLSELLSAVRLLRRAYFLTSRGKRQAAVVPAELGEAVERAGGPDKATAILANHHESAIKALAPPAEPARAPAKAAPAPPKPARPTQPKQAARRPPVEPEYGGVELIVAQSCADLAYKRANPEQILRLERVKTAAKDGEEDYAVADAAYEMGLVKDADIAAARKG